MPTRRGDGVSDKSARIEGARAGAPHRSPTSDVAWKHDCEQANETLHLFSKFWRSKPYPHSAINLAVETLHRNDITNQRQSFIPHYSSPPIQDNLTLLTFY